LRPRRAAEKIAAVGDEHGRDAFGRPVAETATLTPVPASAPAPPVERRPRRSPLPVLFTIAAVVVTALVLVRADHADQTSPAVIGRELDGHALGERSLVRAANFRRALGQARRAMARDEDLLSIRLTPQELSTMVRDPNGHTRLVDVGLDFAVRARDWSTDTSSTPLDVAALDPRVPERIVRGALRGAGADDTHLAYASLTGGDPPTWYVSLDDVPIGEQAWSADLAGVAVTHPGELPEAHGLTGRSLLRPANLAAALEQVAAHGRRVTSLRLAPDRLDATVGDHDVQVDAAQRIIVRDRPGSASPGGVRLDRIDPQAPARAVAAAARKGAIPTARIDYVVLSGDGWSVFFQDVSPRRQAWRADLAGRHVERIG
jgi:hypothetical protein